MICMIPKVNLGVGVMGFQALKYLKIGTCPASQKLLANMEKTLIYIGNHPKFHLPCSLRHS